MPAVNPTPPRQRKRKIPRILHLCLITLASPLIRKIALPTAGWITNPSHTIGRSADTSLRSGANVVLNQRQCQYSGRPRPILTRTDDSRQGRARDGGGNITALVAAIQSLSATHKCHPCGRIERRSIEGQ